MAKKRNLKKEKAERNEVYAKKYRKAKPERVKRGGKFAAWCRTPGHPASCSCTLPTREEVIALSQPKRR